MVFKTGDKIVAHTRLAATGEDGITLFASGETITIGKIVSADQAQDWLDRGSAGPFVTATPPAAPAA